MRVLSGLLLVLAAVPAFSQSPADALRGATAKITASELPDGYRAVSLGDASGPGGLGVYGLMGLGAGGGEGAEAAKSSLFFSLLGATFVDPDEFAALLDGKRPRVKGYSVDFVAMVADSTGTRGGGVPTPVFTETWIEAARVVQWSPRPALTKARILEVFGKGGVPGETAGDRTVGLSNVKQVALGLMMYASDEDDKFPKADSTAAARALVMPYLKSEEVWTSPAGGRILYNTALSGVAQTSLEKVAETPLVWEEKAAPDGTRAVGFADGHAKRVGEAEWSRLWKDELRRRAEAKARLRS